MTTIPMPATAPTAQSRASPSVVPKSPAEGHFIRPEKVPETKP